MKKSMIFVLLFISLFFASCGKATPEQPQTAQPSTSAVATTAAQSAPITWDEITENGVNEELLINNIDTEALEYIAAELQALVDEEAEYERENPEVVLTEGWTRVFKSEHYKNVMSLGEKAMKPLYLIVYKSPSANQYEYICAYALYELSGYCFEDGDGTMTWSNSKEFLTVFNEQILKERQQ